MNTQLTQIRQSHNLTSQQVADQAGLLLRVEYVAEIGGLVEQEEAEAIARALSEITGKYYTVAMLGLTIKTTEAER